MGQPRIGATKFHSSGRYSHDVGACRRGDGDADYNESVERRSIASATVPAKDELVQTRRGTFRGILGRRRAGSLTSASVRAVGTFRYELLVQFAWLTHEATEEAKGGP